MLLLKIILISLLIVTYCAALPRTVTILGNVFKNMAKKHQYIGTVNAYSHRINLVEPNKMIIKFPQVNFK